MSAALKLSVLRQDGTSVDALQQEDFRDVNLSRPAQTAMEGERQALALLSIIHRLSSAWSEDACLIFITDLKFCPHCGANPKYPGCCSDREG